MKRKRFTFAAIVGVIAVAMLSPSSAQQRRSVDWPLHNLDLAGSRFSTLDQINTSNVKSLTPRWLFQHGVIDGVSNQTTPGHRRRRDVRDRFPRKRVRRRTPPTGICCGPTTSPVSSAAEAREGYIFRNRGVCYADGVVYVGRRARSCSRSTPRPESRFQASATTVRPA